MAGLFQGPEELNKENSFEAGCWQRAPSAELRPGDYPSQRSLHTAAVYNGCMFLFGGYDGVTRINDFLAFDFGKKTWFTVPAAGRPPSPRDRHTTSVCGDSMFVFGGYDGATRINDFHKFDFESKRWSEIDDAAGTPPSPRHSHSSVVYDNSLYIFGGYDGTYKNDFHKYEIASNTWRPVFAGGTAPKPRYRTSAVVHNRYMFLFGGHDGIRHLNDFLSFDFETQVWSIVRCEGGIPSPRDSHIAVTYGKCMFVFGGSTGHPTNDMYQYDFVSRSWSTVQTRGVPPHPRFCHTAAVHDRAMYIFGGYDGTTRLDDFVMYRFGANVVPFDIPKSTLIHDLHEYVNNQMFSDITFIDKPVYAHKLMCMRCSYFKAMLTSEMRESNEREIVLPDVRHNVFLAFLQYLYTDCLPSSVLQHTQPEADIIMDEPEGQSKTSSLVFSTRALDKIEYNPDTNLEEYRSSTNASLSASAMFAVGNGDINNTMALDLIEVADRFGVDRLKRLCEATILEAINVETASSILHAADMHHADGLRKHCMEFILTHFDEVTKSRNFEEMGRVNMDLVFEILRRR